MLWSSTRSVCRVKLKLLHQLRAGVQSFKALPAGGAFVAVDYILDSARRENTMGLAISLNILLEFGREQSYDYTFQVGHLSDIPLLHCIASVLTARRCLIPGAPSCLKALTL